MFFKNEDAATEEMGEINSSIIIAFSIASIPTAFIVGACYEILGRRFTLMTFSFLVPFTLVLVPYTAPSIIWLTVAKIIIGFGFMAQKSNPLIVDYIKKESRGTASSLKSLGSIGGQVGSMLIFLNIARHFDNGTAFQVTAIILYFMTLPLTWMVREPADFSVE